MNIQLGILDIKPATEHKELLAQRVSDTLLKLSDANQIGVAEIDQQLSDTAAFCAHYQIGANQAANCVVLEAKRGDKSWFAACVVLSSTRADVNGLARRTLDAKKVSFASIDQAVTRTAMEYGAITPIGLPDDWPILVDRAVIETPYVVVGSGLRSSKIILPGKLLASIPNVQILDNLGMHVQVS